MVIVKNLVLSKKLGTGAFGQIYLALSKTNQNERYAAKLEDKSCKHPQLHFQAKLYRYLNGNGNQRGIPKVYSMTIEGQYNVMVMDLLGKSLQDMFVKQNKKMSLKTVLMLADQMIDRIEFMHTKYFLHRDIKPDNFLMGIGSKKGLVYVVDMGLAKKYIRDGQHIPYKDNKQLTGTARYASINTHLGIQQCNFVQTARRDDLQSLGYVLLYLLRGSLPWQNMKSNNKKDKYSMIMQKKMSTPLQVLCKGNPGQLITYLNQCKKMKFQQKPDYSYLKELLRHAMSSNGYEYDWYYDWSKHGQQVKQNQEKVVMNKDMQLVKDKYNSQINNINKLKRNNHSNSKDVSMQRKNVRQKNTSYEKLKLTSNSYNKQNSLLKTLPLSNNKYTGPKISTIKY